MLFKSLTLISLLFVSTKVFAYPDFISYGYSTCITCHYNGFGNGPLNDYGKALFAQEIAARDIFSSSTTDEELADSSGFLGKTELPSWFKPSIKYRGLWFQTEPGSTRSVRRYIDMQRDINLASFTSGQGFGIVANYGLLNRPTDLYGKGDMTTSIMRELYMRVKLSKSLYVYAGLMDKVFGIRHSDHTAYSRLRTELTQNSQTHGVILHWLEPGYEIAIHGFAGNQAEIESRRYKGGSTMFEYVIRENHKIGFSFMQEKNDDNQKTAYAIHDKVQIGKGSSIVGELGMVDDQRTLATSSNKGPYAYLQNTVLLRRGYNLLTTVERNQIDTETSSTELWKWGVGFLTFPLPKTEVRLQAVNNRTILQETGAKDSWQLQSQFHLSW